MDPRVQLTGLGYDLVTLKVGEEPLKLGERKLTVVRGEDGKAKLVIEGPDDGDIELNPSKPDPRNDPPQPVDPNSDRPNKLVELHN